jgi:hypothetical protein
MEEKKEEVSTEVQVEEIKKKLNDLMDMSETEELLKSTEKIFEHEGVTYRVRKPNFREKQEVYQKRVEKFTELLSNDKYSLEKDLIKVYLKRDIDIEAMNLEIFNKVKRRDELMLQLGGVIKDGGSDTDLSKYKDEIKGLNSEIQMLSIQKTQLLEFSIENQVMVFVYSYMTYLISEKKDGENWIRVWKTFKDFENDSGNIINRLSYYATLMTSSNEM